jgi:hypothetical protein
MDPDKHPGITNSGVNKLIKDSVDSVLQNTSLRNLYCDALQECVKSYIGKYPYCANGSSWKIKEEINIQHYKPGGGFHSWHTERQMWHEPQVSRHLVFMTYLNDVLDKGETEFYHQKLKVKPEKGLTLIWPTDWTFYHRSIPSFTQHKYVVTGWFSYVKDDN